MKLNRTLDLPAKKISFTRIFGTGRPAANGVVGWEMEPPEEGKRYRVYLGRGKILKTSVITEIQRTPHAIFVRTKNSLYQIEYL
jgi:hypothetical protein